MKNEKLKTKSAELCVYCDAPSEVNTSEGLPVCLECLGLHHGDSSRAFRMTDGRSMSLMNGFIVPEHEKGCGCGCEDFGRSFLNTPLSPPLIGGKVTKVEEPSLFELDLARRPHRWKEIRDLTASMLRSIAREVTKFEVALLDAAGLPGVEEVREFVLSGGKSNNPLSPPLIRGMKNIEEDELKAILKKIIDQLIGSGGKIDLNSMPIYPFHILGSFNVGLDKTRQAIEKIVDNADLLPSPIIGSFENEYLSSLSKEGMQRIRSQIATKYKNQILMIIRDGAAEGLSPLRIASDLHQAVGEGQMWYWNRLARSEISIALDAAFVAEAKQDGVGYEKWSTSANPCPICAPLDGQVWRVGEGPRVVYSTHPHCLCVKYPLINPPQSVQEAVDHGDFAYI